MSMLSIILLVLLVTAVMIISKMNREGELKEELVREKLASSEKDVKWYKTATEEAHSIIKNLRTYIESHSADLLRNKSLTLRLRLEDEDEVICEDEIEDLTYHHLTDNEIKLFNEVMSSLGVDIVSIDRESETLNIQEQIDKLINEAGMFYPQ